MFLSVSYVSPMTLINIMEECDVMWTYLTRMDECDEISPIYENKGRPLIPGAEVLLLTSCHRRANGATQTVVPESGLHYRDCVHGSSYILPIEFNFRLTGFYFPTEFLA